MKKAHDPRPKTCNMEQQWGSQITGIGGKVVR
jgi:hypothetical protein